MQGQLQAVSDAFQNVAAYSKQSSESSGCKFSVAHRMRDVLVPEIILDQSGVRAPVSEGISAWVFCALLFSKESRTSGVKGKCIHIYCSTF
jgi:hypothetical protein